MTRKVIVVGIGSMGRAWCDRMLPPNIRDGLIEVVAAVDVSPVSVEYAQKSLSLRADQCYTDMGKAFDEVKADFCCVKARDLATRKIKDEITRSTR